jgi:hypothetical protein
MKSLSNGNKYSHEIRRRYGIINPDISTFEGELT